MIEDEKEVAMATTNYSKADAVATKLVSKYTKTIGFRGASVECNRSLGTYYIVLALEPGTKIDVPKSIDHVEIQTREVKKRLIR